MTPEVENRFERIEATLASITERLNAPADSEQATRHLINAGTEQVTKRMGTFDRRMLDIQQQTAVNQEQIAANPAGMTVLRGILADYLSSRN